MILREGVNCESCREKYTYLQGKYGEVVMYFFDEKRKEITFYSSIFFKEFFGENVKTYKIKIKKVPSEQISGYFDYHITCPLCRKFILAYHNVPPDWKVKVSSTEHLGVIRNPYYGA